MPIFAANITMMFTEVPFLERFEAAAQAGFGAVEFLTPYEHSAEVVAKCAQDAGVSISLFNLPPGDWSAGERGLACVPGREAEFQRGIDTAVHYAEVLNTRHLHAMAGIVPAGANPKECHSVLISNLRLAAERVASKGITLLLEAINTRDMPGFIVSR